MALINMKMVKLHSVCHKYLMSCHESIFNVISSNFKLLSRKRKIKHIKNHVLSKIEKTAVSFDPFGHMFVNNIFPEDFYHSVREHLLSNKASDKAQERLQDNQKFINKRYNLSKNLDELSCLLREVFSDPDIKRALARKFYVNVTAKLVEELTIHKEFEYVFTAPDRFQNIHTDIPPKFMSLVFYIPNKILSEEEELLNATILYDKNLQPAYKARYRENSVCIFAPHFYSYHGFSTTIERDSLVVFYVNQKDLDIWRKKSEQETESYIEIRDQIEEKLIRNPLIEYGVNPERIRAEKEQCLINSPRGRVLMENIRTDDLG